MSEQNDTTTHLHKEHVSLVITAPVNCERLLLHEPTAHRPQVNVITMLKHTQDNQSYNKFLM